MAENTPTQLLIALLETNENPDIPEIQELLNEGADINIRFSIALITPLMIAASRHSLRVVTFLVQRGADINVRSRYYGETALGKAVDGMYQDRFPIVRYLIEQGAIVDPDILTKVRTLPPNNILDYVLQNGADINARNQRTRETILFKDSDYRVKEHLINLGININLQDIYGDTVLNRVIFNGDLRAIKLYINHGADFNIPNNQGVSPLQMGLRSNIPEIAEYFRNLKTGLRTKMILEKLVIPRQSDVSDPALNNDILRHIASLAGRLPQEFGKKKRKVLSRLTSEIGYLKKIIKNNC